MQYTGTSGRTKQRDAHVSTLLNKLDGITAGTVVASKFLMVDSSYGLTGMGKIQFTRAGTTVGAAAASAVIAGVGTDTSPCISSAANAKFLEFRCSTTKAGASDSRGMYLRLAFDGEHASAGGEALRAFSMVNENIGTAHGAHISLGFKAEAGGSECSGLGVAVRGTLHIPAIASWAPTGTYAALQAEVYADGATSDPAGMTELSFIRVVSGGNSTGRADIDDDAHIFSFQGFTAASGTAHAISSTSLAELPGSSIGFRCVVGSTVYYIPAVVSTEWN
jgi:hypothetical protein